MNDLDNNQKAKLLALKQEQDAQKAAKTPAEQIIDSGAIPEAKKEEQAAEAVPEPAPIVDATKEEASTTTPPPNAVDHSEEIDFKWDAELEQTPAPAQTTGVDFKKIGSALNLEVTNEDEFVKTVSEKMSKLKELEETQSKALEGVPDSLKETLEIARKGGDWQSFIGNSLIDLTKQDPIDLFEQEYERVNAYRFKKEDGTIDYEALDNALDNMDDGMKSMQGNVIKQQLMAQQQQRKQAVLAEASRAQERFNKELFDAAKELPQYFPKEEWGVNVEPKHAASVVDGIMTGKLVKKHLGDIDPATLAKLDGKKLAKAIFLLEASKNIAQHQYKQGIVAGKRELLDKTQNPQITTPSISAAPDVADDKKPKTAVEKLKEKFKVGQGSL